MAIAQPSHVSALVFLGDSGSRTFIFVTYESLMRPPKDPLYFACASFAEHYVISSSSSSRDISY